MGLTEILRRAVLGTALAVMPASYSGCGSAQKQEESLDVKVQSDTTNAEGRAFEGTANEITVLSNSGSPLSQVYVALHQINSSGAVYLARTAQNEGGIAVYSAQIAQPVKTTQPLRGKKQSSLESGRTLTIRPAEGATVFDQNSNEVVYDLYQHWVVGNEYQCNGMYTTKQLLEGRALALDLVGIVAYFDPAVSGKVALINDTLQYLIAKGFLKDIEPDKKWFVLNPANPTGFPLTLMRGLAQQIFDEGTYDALNGKCVDKTGGDSCFTEGCPEPDCVFYDDFNGTELDECRWDEDLRGGNPIVRDGKLQLSNSSIVGTTLGGIGWELCKSKFIIEYRVQIIGEGDDVSSFSLGYLDIVFSSDYGYTLNCNPGEEGYAQVDIWKWNTIKVEGDGSKAYLYVNDALKLSTPCNQKEIGALDISGPGGSPMLFVDYVLEKCE